MHYLGIDVALKESAVRVMDREGRVVCEARLPSDPDAIADFLEARGIEFERIEFERIGIEAGCTAVWLFAGLQSLDLAAVCLEPRHAAAHCAPVSATRTTATTRAASPTWCG